jgi:CheY-like chemotaxis protein
MRPASRVVVADDVQDSADTVAELLSAQGIEARAVYEGREAVKLAHAWNPDGAVLDLALPGLTGYEVAGKLRERFGTGIRLVAYTGYATDEVREKARLSGFDDFLVKPVEPTQLLLALGKPITDLVRRSLDLRVEQLRRQIELGHRLLEHGLARPEALSVICAFLERAFHSCRESLRDLPLEEAERDRLASEISRVEARIEHARKVH